MAVLVTGSAGFIGFHLARRLLDETPGDPVALDLLADAAALEENLPAARAAAREALNRDPGNPARELKLGSLELRAPADPDTFRAGKARLLPKRAQQ